MAGDPISLYRLSIFKKQTAILVGVHRMDHYRQWIADHRSKIFRQTIWILRIRPSIFNRHHTLCHWHGGTRTGKFQTPRVFDIQQMGQGLLAGYLFNSPINNLHPLYLNIRTRLNKLSGLAGYAAFNSFNIIHICIEFNKSLSSIWL